MEQYDNIINMRKIVTFILIMSIIVNILTANAIAGTDQCNVTESRQFTVMNEDIRLLRETESQVMLRVSKWDAIAGRQFIPDSMKIIFIDSITVLAEDEFSINEFDNWIQININSEYIEFQDVKACTFYYRLLYPENLEKGYSLLLTDDLYNQGFSVKTVPVCPQDGHKIIMKKGKYQIMLVRNSIILNKDVFDVEGGQVLRLKTDPFVYSSPDLGVAYLLGGLSCGILLVTGMSMSQRMEPYETDYDELMTNGGAICIPCIASYNTYAALQPILFISGLLLGFATIAGSASIVNSRYKSYQKKNHIELISIAEVKRNSNE